MEQQEHIDELIAKHLAGETSVTEEEVLQNWMATSERNELYYAEMKVVHEAGEKINIADKINVNSAWNKFSKTLEKPPVKTTIIKRITASFYAKAAIFVGLLGLGYLFYLQAGEREKLIVFSSFETERSNTLSDGTLVSLQPKSSITYASSFNQRNREIELTGEVYFRVQHNADLPFIIRSGNVFVKDIGTAFTIKANPSDSVVTVSVSEGEVVFYTALNSGITLKKDETGIYNITLKTFRKKETPLANTNPGILQTLDFENVPLQLVIDTLNKVYDAHIQLSCKKLETLELTAAFKEKTATPIVETIAETFNLSITHDHGNLILNGQDCKK